MSTESGWEVIQTATVAIFSPDMREILLIYNKKIDGLVPVGGKFEPTKDRDIADTAVREAWEEVRLGLFPGSGVFLDIEWNSVEDQRVIQEHDFSFPDGKSGHDTLYFFRLHQKPSFSLPKWAYFLDKSSYSRERIEIEKKMYEFRALDIRERILSILISY